MFRRSIITLKLNTTSVSNDKSPDTAQYETELKTRTKQANLATTELKIWEYSPEIDSVITVDQANNIKLFNRGQVQEIKLSSTEALPLVLSAKFARDGKTIIFLTVGETYIFNLANNSITATIKNDIQLKEINRYKINHIKCALHNNRLAYFNPTQGNYVCINLDIQQNKTIGPNMDYTICYGDNHNDCVALNQTAFLLRLNDLIFMLKFGEKLHNDFLVLEPETHSSKRSMKCMTVLNNKQIAIGYGQGLIRIEKMPEPLPKPNPYGRNIPMEHVGIIFTIRDSKERSNVKQIICLDENTLAALHENGEIFICDISKRQSQSLRKFKADYIAASNEQTIIYGNKESPFNTFNYCSILRDNSPYLKDEEFNIHFPRP